MADVVIPHPKAERRIAVVVALDAVGYSHQSEVDEEVAIQEIGALRERVTAGAAAHNGRLFSSAGDGFMLEFAAASAALAFMDGVFANARVPVRAGAHLGEVSTAAHGDLLGHGVNVAARLMAMAAPGELVVSGQLRDALSSAAAKRLSPRGRVKLDKMDTRVDLYVIASPWGAARRRRTLLSQLDAQTLMRLARGRWRLLTAATAALAALAIGWAVTRPSAYVFDDIELISTQRDEASPALSQDGRFIVYQTNMDEVRGVNTDLFMRDIASGEETQLTSDPDFLETAPALSPAVDRLAYVRSVPPRRRRGDERCQIIVRTLPHGVDRLAGQCEGAPGSPWLAWTPDGAALMFSDYLSGPGSAQVIRVLDVQTGNARTLVPPPESGLGDVYAAVSPDGRRVAFTRYLWGSKGDVYVYDLRREQLTRITHEQQAAHAAWADSQRLFVFRRSGGNTELWLYNADGGRGERQMLLFNEMRRPTVAAGLIAFRVDRSTFGLWRLEPGGASPAAVTDAPAYVAAFSPDGVLGFITGGWLYLQAPRTQPRRFVELTGDNPQGLQWSSDGRRLLYLAFVDGQARLFVIEAASGVIRAVRLPTGAEMPIYAAWSADGRSVLYVAHSAAGMRLLRVGLQGERAPALVADDAWISMLETPEGLFARHLSRPGVWRLKPGRPPEQVFSELRQHATDVYAQQDWTIANGRFYAVDLRTPGRLRILSKPIAGGAVTLVADVAGNLAGSLAVDPQTGAMVYGAAGDTFSDIGLLRFRR